MTFLKNLIRIRDHKRNEDEDMVDKYQLYICPTVLGKGRALFSEETNMQDMQLLETKTYDDGMVFLRYKRKGQKMQS